MYRDDRLKYMFYIFAVVLVFGCNNSEPLDPSIYQNTRTELFKSFPKDSGSVYFIGNSLISEYPIQEYFQTKTYNWGVSGSETKNTLERVDDMMSRHPSKVFLLDGINDLKNGVAFDTALFRYKQIVSKINDVYIISVLPTSGQYEKLNDVIKRFNDSIKPLGNYIDVYSIFIKEGRMNEAYTYDGLHLNSEGYKLLTGKLKPFLK